MPLIKPTCEFILLMLLQVYEGGRAALETLPPAQKHTHQTHQRQLWVLWGRSRNVSQYWPVGPQMPRFHRAVRFALVVK